MIDDLLKLVRLVEKDSSLRELIRSQTLCEVGDKNHRYPIISFTLGSKNPEAPVLFVTGGIHGLERIGAQLAWSLLKTTVDRLLWDKSLIHILQRVRIVIAPLMNPSGYYNFTRSNSFGVDLMRNSPVRAVEKVPFLLGGHRFSNKLPWFQGQSNKLEIENQCLENLFENEAIKSKCVVAVDFHSGFGMKDRLWFPFSYTASPFDDLAEMHILNYLFEQTHPYHIYQVEPQSKGYLLNGDMWDYLFLKFKKQNSGAPFLPLTLEMGSWNWVRKNPLQLFSKHGVFNPIKEHRIKRTYRRHHLLFEFLIKAIYSHETWTNLDSTMRSKHHQLALEKWYGI